MENPGLVTFREMLLLMDEKTAPVKQRRAFASVMAHELAHQWFGDLVTMPWWDDIWLNEAFATWMGNKVVQQSHPEWRFDLSRRSDASGAMDDDSLISARKIRQEIATDDDIQNAFDGITYEKGATVIGMFEGWMGEEPFQRGIQRYLANHPHGNATSAEFLADLEAGSGKRVAKALSTFLDQPGVPLVTATLRCDEKGARLTLSQERYLPAGSKGDAQASSWQIPVCARWGTGKSSERACTLLAGKEGELALPTANRACPSWVMPNAAALGYYRVAYAGTDIDTLLERHGAALTAVERQSVIEDAGALVENGRLPIAEALRRLPALAKDKDPEVVRAALSLAGTARAVFVEEAQRPAMARFISATFGEKARALGFRDASFFPTHRHSVPADATDYEWAYFQQGGGLAVFDLDSDGREDLFASGGAGGHQVFRNLGGGRLSPRRDSAKLLLAHLAGRNADH